jgi:TonB family protein
MIARGRWSLRAKCVEVRLALSAIFFFTARLHAQSLQAPREPVVVSPRPKVDAGVLFPAQALREHFAQAVNVDLVLLVEADGHVSEAKVVAPVGHAFDEAAVLAAQKIVFEPATRDGRPIAVRVKYRYVFSPPAATLAGEVRLRVSDLPVAEAEVTVRDSSSNERTTLTSPSGKWSISDLPAGRVHVKVRAKGALPTESDELLEAGRETNVVLRLAPEASAAPPGPAETVIVVKAARPAREVSKRTLSSDEIRHSAGTQGDALLSVQNLPGIARPPPFSGALVVRGSAPDDTLVMIDGTEVPLAFHFGGLSSVVPTELVDQIDFYPGNFSARYGRAMGGIVDTSLRAPKTNGYHLVIENSVLGFRGIVEGPLGHGYSFFAAGQRSWLDLLLTPLLKATGSEQTALPRWADYQLAIQKDFDPSSSARVLFFGSSDAFDVAQPIANAGDPSSAGALGYHTSFWRAQASFDSQLSRRTHLKLTTAYGEDRLAIGLGNNLIDATLHPLSSRAELSHQLAPGIRTNIGWDTLYEPYDFALQLPALTRPGIPSGGPGQLPIRATGSKSLFQPGFYGELELVPWSGARVVPGLRADYDSGTTHWDVSPRINLRQDLQSEFPRTTFKGGVGLYLQPPSPLDTVAGLGQTGLTSNRSVHYDVGMEQELTQNLELSLDVFYKRFDHLVVPGARNAGTGDAYGVEWLLRYKPDPHFFGWISYTLSRSERRDVQSEPSSRFQYDQTHVLALVANYKLGRGWQLGARFRVTSGDLYTPTSTGAYDASVGQQLGVSAFPPYAARLPTFNQLDLRFEKKRTFNAWSLTYFLDVQNVYAASNPLGVSYNYNYTKSAYTNGLPILPIIGVRAEVP